MKESVGFEPAISGFFNMYLLTTGPVLEFMARPE